MALCIKPDVSACCCPNMSGIADSCPPMPPPPRPEDKYFHEIGAEMIGNQLVIRMEKDKSKTKNKRKNAWEPPCDCDVIEIKRPTSTKGPRIVNGGDNNQILFRVHSKAHLNRKDDPYYRPQAIAYKVNRNAATEDDHCRKITVYPHLGGPIFQEVYTDHITEGCQDVYFLRVKKKNDNPEADEGKRNLEVELRTPKPPTKCKPACPKKTTGTCVINEDGSVECKDENKGKKGKGKGGKDGQGGQGGQGGKGGKGGKGKSTRKC